MLPSFSDFLCTFLKNKLSQESSFTCCTDCSKCLNKFAEAIKQQR